MDIILWQTVDYVNRKGRSFQLLAVSESIAYSLTKLDVGMMNRIESDQLHLLHIRFAVICKILFVAKDVHDFCYEVIASLALINLLLHSAL